MKQPAALKHELDVRALSLSLSRAPSLFFSFSRVTVWRMACCPHVMKCDGYCDKSRYNLLDYSPTAILCEWCLWRDASETTVWRYENIFIETFFRFYSVVFCWPMIAKCNQSVLDQIFSDRTIFCCYFRCRFQDIVVFWPRLNICLGTMAWPLDSDLILGNGLLLLFGGSEMKCVIGKIFGLLDARATSLAANRVSS